VNERIAKLPARVRLPLSSAATSLRALIEKFLADRGTHLAAMIAYFALLSLVPLVFLALALLGLFGRADESSYLVRELKTVFPSSSISDIVAVVRTIQDNAAALGLAGGVFLLWTSLSLFSVLESAFNIVYGRPNRPFFHGKALAVVVMLLSLVVLFVGLVVGSVGFEVLKRNAPGLVGNPVVAYLLSVLVSTAAAFIFLTSVYYLLTNARLSFRDVVPGALVASVLLQATFQILPTFFRLSSEDILALRALGTPVLLLIWLYVLANVIVFGAELNWWLTRHRRVEAEDATGLA
jgi:membrane protein